MAYLYVKSPFLDHDLECQVCHETSETRYVHPRPEGAIRKSPNEPYPGHDKPICVPCMELWAEKNHAYRPFENDVDIDNLVLGWLKGLGLGADEIKAQVDLVPQEIIDAIPRLSLKSLMAGLFGKTPGFGLCSRPGLGKSQAIAALIKSGLTQFATNAAPFRKLPAQINTIAWMNVPLTVSRWRLDGISPQVGLDVRQAQQAKLLVLDDLGREVRRSSVGEDVATGHLDAIITYRDREGAPTIWTSNCEEAELNERYATPIARRLFRLNAPAWVTA